MGKYKKKSDPELLLVSFCDIITVTCVALFMAMILVIWEAMKTPLIRPTPIASAITNAAIYLECRNNHVFPVDRSGLIMRVREEARRQLIGTDTGIERGLQSLVALNLEDEYYKVSNNHLMIGMIALEPKPGVVGIDKVTALATNGLLDRILGKYHTNSHYLVFLVRDDSFPVFRAVRDAAARRGWSSGWEYLDRTEPLTFAGIMGRIGSQ